MIFLPATLFAAATAALLNLWLGYRIGQIRQSAKISIGDAGHEPLIRRMRAQANFIEHAPITLILFAVVEATTGASLWLWGLAGLFLLARVAHGLGMEGGNFQRWRTIGIMISFMVELLLAGQALWIVFRW